MKKRILTGDRPTGPLHLGHYVGSLQNRVRLQHEYDTYILIADVQALTDNFEHPEKLEANIFEVALDYLAVGLDPEKVKFVVQSMVPELTELTIYFMNLVTVATLERNPTVKEEIKQRNFIKGRTGGFLVVSDFAGRRHRDLQGRAGAGRRGSVADDRADPRDRAALQPALRQSAGRAARDAGADGAAAGHRRRRQDVEVTRQLHLPGRSDRAVRKRVMSMFTDPTRIHPTDPGHVEGNPVFTYHDVFNPDKAEVEELKERYRKGTVGDVEVKQKLYDALEAFLRPIRERRGEFAAKPARVHEIIMEGTRKGRAVAQSTMDEVRAAMKLDYKLGG